MVNFPDIDPALILSNQSPGPLGMGKYRNIGQNSINYYNAMIDADQIDGFMNTWGYTIFRTDYSSPDSDERFEKAVKRLEAYAVHWLFNDLNNPRTWRKEVFDPRAMCEVRSRLQNKVIQDRAALNLATRERVGEIFDAWTHIYKDDPENWRNPRFQYAIMLDKESIDSVLALPEEPTEAKGPECYYSWVTVISNQVRDERRLWLRIGVYDVLWVHWFAETQIEFWFEEYVAEYDKEEGLINLYGPPEMSVSTFAPLNLDTPWEQPMDTTPGHPPRLLANIGIYERLEAPRASESPEGRART